MVLWKLTRPSRTNTQKRYPFQYRRLECKSRKSRDTWSNWMASLTRWTWVWVNSGSWCWTGRPGMLRFMGSQRVRHDWATELNWTEWIIEKAREFQKNSYFCFINYAKAFDYVDHYKLWKILKEMDIQDHLTCLLRNLYSGQEVTEPDMEQQTGSKLGKEFIKAICCHPVYLTIWRAYTTYKMLGRMTHKLESRLPGEISTTSDIQMIPL